MRCGAAPLGSADAAIPTKYMVAVAMTVAKLIGSFAGP